MPQKYQKYKELYLKPILGSSMQRMDSSAIRRMFDLSAQLKDPINLSIGQPHFATPPAIIEALCQATRAGHTSYTPTQGILPLREAMAQKYQEVNGFTAEPEHILISAGVAALIQLLFLACVQKGDRILLTDPSFLIYKSLAKFFGARVATIAENFDVNEMNIQTLSAHNLKLIIICHPSNPSGHIFSQQQLEFLSRLADKTGALLVSDEIYELYDYDKRFKSAACIYPRTLTFSGFSKSYSMTGLRLAAAHGPPEIIQALTTLQQYTIVCAPAPVQHAGLTALKTNMQSYVADYRKNRDYCLTHLRKRNTLRYEYPAGAFYIFVDIGATGQNDQDFIERAIQEKQLLLVPGRIFSASQTHVRISYAVPHTILQKGIGALGDLLE